MKILTFTTLYPNQCMPQHGLFIKTRINYMAAQGHEIKVVAPVPFSLKLKINPQWSVFRQIPKEEEIDGIKVYHPRYFVTPKIGRSLYGYFMFLSVYRFIKKLKKTFDFDLIDAHFVYPDGLAAVIIGNLLGKKVILNARGTDINWYPKFKMIRPLIQYTLNQAAGIISVSEYLKNEMIALGVSGDKIRLIPNGVDSNIFYFKDKDTTRQKLKLPKETKIILTVGLLIERKGFHFLIEALNHIKDQNTHLYIIGKGAYESYLKNLIQKYRLEEKVKILNEKTQLELSDWYAAADIFILTSLREGRPNVVVEALACGTPVISMNKWGLNNLVNIDKGILLDDYEPVKIAVAIKEVLSRCWDRQKISESMKGHTWIKTAQKAIDFMQTLYDQRDILFFSSDDWNSGLKTSKYHISTRLAKGHRVFFINSLGLRAPTFSRNDANKIIAKLKKYFKGTQNIQNNLYVYTPILLPWHGIGVIRWLNKLLLQAQFHLMMMRYKIMDPDIWTFLPNTLDLIAKLPHKKLIYYCVDDMSSFKGVATDVIRRQDELLTRQADEVFAVSNELYRKKRQWNPHTHYAPHGVDFELFNQAHLNGASKKPLDLENIPKPIIGFYGLISSDWIDYSLIKYLARMRPQWSFIFIGKVDLKNGEKLPLSENIHYLPVKPYEELYRYSRFFDVAILPFAVNILTAHSHPLKILEYLSAGKPVVCTDIPEAQRYAQLISIASRHEDFLKRIEECLENDTAAQKAARIEFASQNSWDKRFDEIQTIIIHNNS